MAVRMLQRRGTAAQWAAVNPILGDGEIGIAKDVGVIKVGDGNTSWADLDIVYEATPAVLSVVGRTGDIVINADDIDDATAVGVALLTASDPGAVLDILGATDTGLALLRTAGPSAARTALGATALGAALFMTPSAADIRSRAGITQTGAAIATAVDAPSARAAIGAGTGNGNGNVIGTGVTGIRSLTQTEYNALATKDAAVLYVIVG